jgi:hypothetical protein
MTIQQYQTLTGRTVPQSQQASVTAQIRRAKADLERLLGWSLDKNKVLVNQYKEAGKTSTDFVCDWDDEDLSDPDAVVTAYRLFPYHENDIYLAVDPFTKLHAVKLVFMRSGEDGDGVTTHTFSDSEMRVVIKNGFAKYIEKCDPCWWRCGACGCNDCVQLAVDADWLYADCLPDDLLYLWADMATYNLDCKKDIKRESLGTHSYEKFDRSKPWETAEGITLIKKYAGPNGTGQRRLT